MTLQTQPRRVTETLDPKLFDGLSVYQDVVLAGQTVRSGVRDCHQRWRVIEPHLPAAGAFLDIGSNFGWFGLKICESRPGAVVASVEADPRSALIQRKVLSSHAHRRIALLTDRADCRLVSRFAAAGQRFDAALCLSILHWIPDHRAFLTQLGQIAARIVIEYPHPDEADAGSTKIRAEIGDLAEYLRRLFPNRPVEQIGDCASHLSSQYRRPIWLVGEADSTPTVPSGINARSMLESGLSWPPRSWWLNSLERGNFPQTGQPSLTAHGVQGKRADWERLSRRLERLPESSLYTRSGYVQRQLLRVMRGVSRRAREILSASR